MTVGWIENSTLKGCQCTNCGLLKVAFDSALRCMLGCSKHAKSLREALPFYPGRLQLAMRPSAAPGCSC